MKKDFIYDVIFVLLVLAAIFSGLSIFSYSAEDSAFLHETVSREDLKVHNIFGGVGAGFSDIMGAAMGWVALLVPFALVYVLGLYVKLYRGKLSGPKMTRGILSLVILLITVAIVSGFKGGNDFFYAPQPVGGLLGLLAPYIEGIVGKVGGIVFSVVIIILALMGMTPLSLIKLTDRMAGKIEGSDTEAGLLDRISQRMSEYREEKRQEKEEKRIRAEARAIRQRELLAQAELDEDIVMPVRQTKAQASPESYSQDERQIDPVTHKRFENEPIIRKMHEAPEHVRPPRAKVIQEPEDTELVASHTEEVITRTADQPRKPVKVEPVQISIPPEELMDGEGAPPPPSLPLFKSAPKQSIYEAFQEENLEDLLELAPDKYRNNKTPVASFTKTVPRSSSRNIISGKRYRIPFNLLDEVVDDVHQPEPSELRTQADLLLGKLRDFGVDGRIKEICPGPVVTLFEFEPAPGIKINKISNLENDLALAMSAISIRIIAPIPGKAVVGIEVPNKERMMVGLRELVETAEFKEAESPLSVALGKDISGVPYLSDLRKMPHLLVAGTTGSGKSVCINTLICSIIFKASPEAVKFVLIDPKMVELSVYDGIPHLAAPVVTDPRKAAAVLNNVVKEMERRYSLLASCKVRNIDSYNSGADSDPELESMPYMLVIVDEFADLMMVAGKEVENSIIRIAQMARAVGIHLVLATQRPSVNVITGIIKANMPARISFRVSSKIDSRTILDQNGAELLLGRGDSLFIPPGSSDPTRIHGCFVSEAEVLRIVDALKKFGEPEYDMALLEEEASTGGDFEDEEIDSRYEEALKLVREKGMASISMIQRHLRIGYNRAARIVETMERQGLIGSSDGTSKPRELL